MAERTLENRYRLLAAGFGDSPRGLVWKGRLAAGYRPAMDLLVLSFGSDLALAPREIDRQHVGDMLATFLPGRLGGAESYRREVVDLLEDFLLFVAEEEGVPSLWDWVSAVADGREAFERAIADPDRPRYVPARQEPDRRPAAKIGRNDPCPCGSGRKYKACCLRGL